MAKTEFICKSRLLTIITWISIYEDHDTDLIKPVLVNHHDAIETTVPSPRSPYMELTSKSES